MPVYPVPASVAAAQLESVTAPRTDRDVDSRPVVLCFPGGGCPPWIYAKVADACPEFRFVVYDYLFDSELAGGDRDWPNLIARACAIAESFGKPVHVMGHSMGGALTLSVLAERPDLFRSAVICSTGMSASSHLDAGMPQRMASGFPPEERERFARSCLHHVAGRELDDLISHLGVIDVDLFRSLSASQREQDLEARAQSITTPVTLCHGIWDKRRKFESATEMHASIRDSLLYVLDAGHTPMLEAPAEVARLLRASVTAHDRS